MSSSASGASWERLFWLLFERTTNPVALLDDERRVVAANDPALEVLGRSRGQLVGSVIADLIVARERTEADANWQEFLASGEDFGRWTFERSDGSETVLSVAGRLAIVGDRRLAIYVVLQEEHSLLRPSVAGSSDLPLSDREREVVTLIALGRATNDIASELHISAETVKTHVRNAMRKLNTHTRAELVAVALSSERAIHLPRLGD